MITMLYFTHLSSFFLLGLSIGFLSVVKLKDLRKIVLSLLTFLPASICFIIYFLHMQDFGSKEIVFRSFAAKLSSLGSIFISFAPNIDIVFACLFLLLLLLIFLKSTKNILKNVFFFLTLLLFIVFLLLPAGLGDAGWHIDNRVIPFLIFIFLASVLPKAGRLPRAIVFLLLFLFIFEISYITYYYVTIDKELRVYYSGIQKIPPRQKILPISAAGPIGRVNPFLHFWCYYHIDKGGASPYVFALDHYPIKYKRSFAAPSRLWVLGGHIEEVELSKFIKFYDSIVVLGRNSDVFTKVGRHATCVFSQEKIRIFKNNAS